MTTNSNVLAMRRQSKSKDDFEARAELKQQIKLALQRNAARAAKRAMGDFQ